jgi:prephenate dehydrogenase
MPAIFKKLQPHWSEHTLYMDAGSTKGSVITALKATFFYAQHEQ